MENVNNETVEELLEETEVCEEASAEPEVKYVDKSTLHLTEQCIAKVMYKPVTTLYIGVAAGIAFIAMMNLATVILGLFILAYTLFVSFVVKDAPAMDIYSTFALIYKLDEPTLVRKVDYKDIEEWTCTDNEGKSNCVKIKLANGEIIYKDTFQSAKVYRLFNKMMRDKESRIVQHRKMEEKNRQMKSKFRFKLPFKWPFGNKK